METASEDVPRQHPGTRKRRRSDSGQKVTTTRSFMTKLKEYSFSFAEPRTRLHKVGFPRHTWADCGDDPTHLLPISVHTFILKTIKDELSKCCIRCDEIITLNTETPMLKTPHLIIQICAMQEDTTDWFIAAHNIWQQLSFILEKHMPEFAGDNLQIGIWKPTDIGTYYDGLVFRSSSEGTVPDDVDSEGTVPNDAEPEAPVSLGKSPERELRLSGRSKRPCRR